MNKLTKAQDRVFRFICSFLEEEGYPPTYSDIASQFGFSSDGTVKTHLEILERKGYLQRQGKARGIKILKPIEPQYIPILGQIAAGEPILAVENFLGSINDIQAIKYKEGRIALRIRGDSMINAGILDGDIAIIQTDIQINSGQIAAVMIDGDATLKRVYIEGYQVRLKAENDAYEDRIIDKNTFDSKIIGKYIALIRKV